VSVSLSTNVAFQYDGNGNLINDGLRNFVYDDENELIQVSVSNAWMSQFSYDARMRRRIRTEYAWQSSTWVQTNQVYYVYDGNLVIQERNADNLPVTTYTRGNDLSGSLEGAGGIGGLLSMTLNTGPGPASANSMYYHRDGNGNVTTLINPSQYIVAKYLYDAFGNTISKFGLLADANRYRSSSKEWNPNPGMYYYLYRYYDPNLQRWPNRDPIGEQGGINLYEFVRNNPISQIDPFGFLNVSIQVSSIILPPYNVLGSDESGIKTEQSLIVNENGLVHDFPPFIGDNAPPFGVNWPVNGSAVLTENVYANNNNVFVRLSGIAHTAFFPAGINIRYHLNPA
jgi:RHS repeat-associated protein